MKIKFLASVLALILLFGCSRSSKMDINTFFEGFNNASELTDFSANNSVFSEKEDMITHYCRINDKLLITLNSLQDGTVYRLSISFDRSGDFNIFKDTVCASISSFCNKDIDTSTSIMSKLRLVPDSLTDRFSITKDTDWYTFNCENSKNATVFIIRAKKYCPETNTSPTLKEH